MKDVKEFQGWRAEEIAKVYLLNSGLVTLLPYNSDTFDFLAMSNKSPEKKIAIEVKATKYSKSDIERVFKKERNQKTNPGLPVLLMYINYDSENGYFEVLRENGKHEIEPLHTETINQKLHELID